MEATGGKVLPLHLAARVRWETAERCVSHHSELTLPMICHELWNRRGLHRLSRTLIRKGLPERLQSPLLLQRRGNSVKLIHQPVPPGCLTRFLNTRLRSEEHTSELQSRQYL